MIDYASVSPPSPKSYQPAACYAQCDTASIVNRTASLVIGPWWRPAVSSTISLPPPTVSVAHNGSTLEVTVGAIDHSDAPVLAVLRDGLVVGLVTPQSPTFYDGGPFRSSTATYTALACYSDCTPVTIADGFAQQTPQGSPVTTPTPRPVVLGLSCTPTEFEVSTSTHCTVVVSPYQPTGSDPVPTGTVFFSLAGNPASNGCQLDPTGSCAADVTAPPGSESADAGVQVDYTGDSTYAPAMATSYGFAVIKRSSATAISCSPTSLPVSAATSCAITVADPDPGAPSQPTGTVTVSDPGGSLSTSRCTLSATGTCNVLDTPVTGSEGTHTLTAIYGGDTDHQASSATSPLTATQRATAAGLNCTPAPVAVTETSTCTITVSDTDAGASSAPSGSVTIARTGGDGVLSASSCALSSSGTCQITYTPSLGSEGTAVLTANYNGDTDHTPSSQSTQLTVTKAPTTLTATPVLANTATTTAYLTVSATLISAATGKPLSGVHLTFSSNGTTLCTATTDERGKASCPGPTALALATAGGGYTVSYSGNNDYLPAATKANLVS
jgi:hypothetical protein